MENINVVTSIIGQDNTLEDYYKRYAEVYWEEVRNQKEYLKSHPDGKLADYLKYIEDKVEQKKKDEQDKINQARQYYKDNYTNKYLKLTSINKTHPEDLYVYLVYIENPAEFDRLYKIDEHTHVDIRCTMYKLMSTTTYGRPETRVEYSESMGITMLPNPWVKSWGDMNVKELSKEEFTKYVDYAENIQKNVRETILAGGPI